jgi:dipeptidyl aminopeptidase/acylaminoacyl peptidase
LLSTIPDGIVRTLTETGYTGPPTRIQEKTVMSSAQPRRWRLWPVAPVLALSLGLVASVAPATAQQATQQGAAMAPTRDPGTKKALGVDDYTRWRTIESAQISGDGKWVSYVYRLANTLPNDSKPVLHLLNLESSQDVAIPNGTNPSFSADSRWIAYQVDSITTGRGGRGGRGGGGPPADTSPAPARGNAAPAAPPRRVEVRELSTGRTRAWQDVASATFSPASNFVILRRRPAGGAGGGGGRGGAPGGAPPGGGGEGGFGSGGGGGAATATPRGVDVLLLDLASGRTQLLGSVGDIAFNRKGDLLAYTVDAAVRDGNGLFVIDLQNGRTHTLDNDAKNYNRLAWTDDGNGLAVLKGREVEKMRERGNMLVAFTDVRASLSNPEQPAAVLDPSSAAGFPSGWVVSDRAPLTWSEDNKRVFFGMMPQSAAPDTARRRSTDSIADVDIWRTQDERIQSVQMIRADADRNFTYREAFDVAAGKYVRLADSTMRDLEVSLDGRWAVGRDTRSYVSDYKRPAADIYRVNTATGERTLILKNQLIGQHVLGIAPDGKTFLYWKDNRFQAYDLDAGTSKTIGNGSAPNFVDTEFDHPGPKPSFGINGYTADGKSVIAVAKYDLWALPLDGGPARNLTNGVGSKGEIRFRYVRLQPIDSAAPRRARSGMEIDLSKPLTLSAYGEYTKKAGFYTLENGQLKEIVYDDAAFGRPVRAAKADKYLFTRETFTEFPDLRVSGPDFKDSKKITEANPQQAEYVWGRRVLFDFKDRDGHRLQGILALPDDYKPGEKRPMIVNFYEKNSQNLHRYSIPSYLGSMGSSPVEAVSRGYITMLPDVYFHTGSSHSDMLDAVEAATKKVIEMGYVDPKHIGINGHSYGGEGAAFIGTRSRLFAAVGMGAGVTDLYTDFNQSWGWSYQVTGGSGANGNDYYLYGQGRWGFSPWEKPDVYHFESALTHVPEVTAPFLIMHGTADPTVAFSEGMNFYNALRYNGKSAVMLAYPGEGHGLRGLANRRDLTIRFFQFFDHYLKGAPAPKWMTDGVPYLVKDTMKEPK